MKPSGPGEDAGGVHAADVPVAAAVRVQVVGVVAGAAVDVVVGDEHAEQRHEHAADKQQERLVAGEVDADGDDERRHADDERRARAGGRRTRFCSETAVE